MRWIPDLANWSPRNRLSAPALATSLARPHTEIPTSAPAPLRRPSDASGAVDHERDGHNRSVTRENAAFIHRRHKRRRCDVSSMRGSNAH